MASSSNNNGGIPRVPLGFRFHPKDSELLQYYLMAKISNHPLPSKDIIKEVNLYDYVDPYALIASHEFMAGEREWYFFTRAVKIGTKVKHTNGSRQRRSRTTARGVWKPSSGELPVMHQGRKIGTKVNLVFNYVNQGKLMKTNWLMQEFKVAETNKSSDEDEWVLCKVYNHRDPLPTTPQVPEIFCNVINSEAEPISVFDHNDMFDIDMLDQPLLSPDPLQLTHWTQETSCNNNVVSSIGQEHTNERRDYLSLQTNNMVDGFQYPSDVASTSGSYHLQSSSGQSFILTMPEPLHTESRDYLSLHANNMVNGFQYPSDVASMSGSYHLQSSSIESFLSMPEPFQGPYSSFNYNSNSMAYDDMFDIDVINQPLI